MGKKKIFDLNATLVANEFIDKYMPDANGDYVKVYLYLLRKGEEDVPVSMVADSLHLTEGDVCRAKKFWANKGLLLEEADTLKGQDPAHEAPLSQGALKETPEDKGGSSQALKFSEELFSEAKARDELRRSYSRTEAKEVLERLDLDSGFKELLFIVQKYLSKILTERDQEVIAFLYDGLKLPSEVIDYMVEYCVGKGHKTMRYIETVGMDWASRGIKTVRQAKKYTKSFDEALKDTDSKKTRGRARSTISLGITRDTDLDGIVKEQVLKRMP